MKNLIDKIRNLTISTARVPYKNDSNFFQTVVFNQKGQKAKFQYNCESSAILGHQKILEKVRTGIDLLSSDNALAS